MDNHRHGMYSSRTTTTLFLPLGKFAASNQLRLPVCRRSVRCSSPVIPLQNQSINISTNQPKASCHTSPSPQRPGCQHRKSRHKIKQRTGDPSTPSRPLKTIGRGRLGERSPWQQRWQLMLGRTFTAHKHCIIKTCSWKAASNPSLNYWQLQDF